VRWHEVVIFDHHGGSRSKLSARRRDCPHDSTATEYFRRRDSTTLLRRQRKAELDIRLDGQGVFGSDQYSGAGNVLGLPFAPAGITEAPEAHSNVQGKSWRPHGLGNTLRSRVARRVPIVDTW
jgi:hypothetical protein